jgi:hypothetical protein
MMFGDYLSGILKMVALSGGTRRLSETSIPSVR